MNFYRFAPSPLLKHLFAALLFFASAKAKAAILAWDPNTEPDVAGYRIHYGTRSGFYDVTLQTTETTIELSALKPGTTYYFAVSAFNTAGLESALSEEVIFTVPAAPPPSNDADGDGLPDDWEVAVGLNPHDAGGANSPAEGATGDPDGDGIPNLLEYAFSSNPLVPSREDLPRIEVSSISEQSGSPSVLIHFRRPAEAASSISYSIETSENLRDWKPASVDLNSSGDDSGLVNLLVQERGSDSSKGFFRVRVSTSGLP